MSISTLATSFALALFVSIAGPPPAAFAAPAPPAEGQPGENLSSDIHFAQDLARWRYFDLAVEWLADLEGKGGLDAAARGRVSLAKATIARLAADWATTREGRKRYYDEGVTHYASALEALGAEMSAEKGEAIVDGLASLLISKGKFYTEEIDRLTAEEAKADDVTAARVAAEEAFKEAVKALNGAYTALKEIEPADPGNLTPEEARIQDLTMFALYRRGESYFFWGLLYPPKDANREDYLNKCAEALVDYQWEAGDESIFSLYAYLYQGLAEFELGRGDPDRAPEHDEKALASLTHIYSENGILFDDLAKLAPEERSFVAELAEKAYLGAARLYREAANRIEASSTIGEADDLSKIASVYALELPAPVLKPALVTGLRNAAIAAITDYEARFQKAKLARSDHGQRALLEKARTMLDAGNSGGALAIVNEVAKATERSLVGVEANSLLAEIAAGGSVTLSPEVLARAADGFLSDAKYADAIAAFHQVLGALKSDTDRAAFAGEAWTKIGGCYETLGRYLEAALAYEQGLKDTPASDDKYGELALAAYNAWDRRYRETKQDFDQKERNRVRDLVTKLGISGDLQFLVAREAFSDALATKDEAERAKKHVAAAAEFDKVADSSNYYERALVYKARSLAGTGKNDEAVKVFDQLLARIADPKFGVALDKKKSVQRDIAAAEGVFYRASVLQELDRHADVLKSLEGYESKFSKQQAFFPNVNLLRVQASVGAGKVAEAEQLLAALKADSPDGAPTVSAMNLLAGAHFDAYKAALAAKDEAKSKEHLKQAADHLAAFNGKTGYGSYQNLRNVGDWYFELGELPLAIDSMKRLTDKFGKNPAHKKAIDFEVKPKLGDAYLRLDPPNCQEAHAILAEVYPLKRKDRNVVRNYARSLGGWLEERDNGATYIEITGVGNYSEAISKWIELKKGIEDAGDKNSPDWWDCLVNSLYCYYLTSKTDPRVKDEALNLLKNWKTINPDLGGEPYRRRLIRLERALQQK